MVLRPAARLTSPTGSSVWASSPARSRRRWPALSQRTADAAATDALLQAMVDASLLVVEHRGPATWYRMLVTVRAFARRRLHEHGGADAAMDALADHVVATGARSSPRPATRGGLAAAAGPAGALRERRHRPALVSGPRRASRPGRSGCAGCSGAWSTRPTPTTSPLWPRRRCPGGPTPPRRGSRTSRRSSRPPANCSAMRAGSRSLAEATLPDADHAPYAPVTLPRLLAHAAHARGDAVQAIELFDEASAAARSREMTGMAMECEAFRASLLADVGRGRRGAIRTGADPGGGPSNRSRPERDLGPHHGGLRAAAPRPRFGFAGDHRSTVPVPARGLPGWGRCRPAVDGHVPVDHRLDCRRREHAADAGRGAARPRGGRVRPADAPRHHRRRAAPAGQAEHRRTWRLPRRHRPG